EFEIQWYDLGCDTASGKETVTLPYNGIGDLLLPKFLTMLGKPAPASSPPASPPPSTSLSPTPTTPSLDQSAEGPTYTNPRFGFTALISESYLATPYT